MTSIAADTKDIEATVGEASRRAARCIFNAQLALPEGVAEYLYAEIWSFGVDNLSRIVREAFAENGFPDPAVQDYFAGAALDIFHAEYDRLNAGLIEPSGVAQ